MTPTAYEGTFENPVIIDDDDDVASSKPEESTHSSVTDLLLGQIFIQPSTASTIRPPVTGRTSALQLSSSSMLPLSLPSTTTTTTSKKRALPASTLPARQPKKTTQRQARATKAASTETAKKRVCTNARTATTLNLKAADVDASFVGATTTTTATTSTSSTSSALVAAKPTTNPAFPYLHYQQHYQQFFQPLIQHQAFPCTASQLQLRETVLRQLYSRKMRTLPVAPEEVVDDKRGHLKITPGANLTPRFKILDLLGEGTFAQVVECWDRTNCIRVAIKIVRSLQKYRDAALMELNTLAAITERDPERTQPCVQYREWFEFGSHICIVFEKLGMSLYEFLRENNFKPVAGPMLRLLAAQIMQGVTFLHSDLDLIHTDLKPENILFVVPGLSDRVQKPKQSSNKIVLIDFGSATFDYQYHTSIVSTRQYRSPEVILGLGWTFSCDIWSAGCILMELYTGEALFQTHDNLDHLAMMERVLGPMPRAFIARSSTDAQAYFLPNGSLRWPVPNTDQNMIRKVRRLTSLRELISPTHNNFYDLVSKMLVYDPTKRLSAREAFNHRFFREGF